MVPLDHSKNGFQTGDLALKKWLHLTFVTCLLVALHVTSCWATLTKPNPEILILNSYHLGYLWSDGEVNGIESTIFGAFPQARITVEYMDTKRVPPEKSFENLYALYQTKYQGHQFDLIVSVDDNALSFLKKYRLDLFGDTPVVFCGVNNFKPEKTLGMKKVTGVTEIHRIEDNLKLFLELHPSLKKVVVVTDVTTSGQISLQEVKAATPSFVNRLDFEYLEGLPLPQLKEYLSNLDSDTVVFLLNYFRDQEGNYYSPKTVMPVISRASSVPVYCFSEFYMNHGATGGIINEGYPHGALAGRIALKVLAGENISKMAVVEGPMRPVFDFREMRRFKLEVSRLPEEALVLNLKNKDQKEILILHSYHAGFFWTSRIAEGLEKVLGQRADLGEVFVEYMDSKRYSSPAYFYQLYELYKNKYAHRQIDLVIVSDDNAFDFARKFRNLLFGSTPIVFCGVNYMKDREAINREEITGVLQSYDIQGTVSAVLNIYPQTEKILVITDNTSTGNQNQKHFAEIIPQVDSSLRLEFTSRLTMEDLLKKLANLDEKTAVLLPVFLRDANNVQFTVPESVKLITEASSRPVFGFHGMYLNHGLAGGSITDGYDQGFMAARLAERVLDGEKASEVPILEKNPHRFVFDYNTLWRFQISRTLLPATSKVLNAPSKFYEKYKRQVDFAIFLFLFLLILLIAQQIRIRRGEKRKEEIESEARTDCLTGTIPRKYFMSEVKGQLEKCRIEGQKLTLCYCDINDLKSVNDSFGHREGDNYIVTMVHIIQSTIRACDRIYRMGGDEFMIVFADCCADGAKNRIRDIREKLADLNEKPGKKYEKGMSFGHAEFDPANPKTLNQLLEETDELMYLDKNRQGVPEKKILPETG